MEVGKKKILLRLSLIAVAVGLLAILGWIFNIPVFKSIYPGLPPMRFNPALVLICLGVSLYLLVKEQWKSLLRVLCSLIVIYGIASIYQDFANVQLGIDEFFVKDKDALQIGYPPGRPPISASLCFIFMASALLLLSTGKNRMILIANYFLHCVTFISFIVILGYFLHLPSLSKLYFFTTLALNMALLLFFLSIGASMLHADKGITSLFTGTKIGNIMARRFFPQTLLFLVIITFLRALAYREQWITEELGIALVTTLFIIVHIFLIGYNAKSLNLLDDKSRIAFEELKKSEEEFRSLFENSLAPVIITDMKTLKPILVNNVAVELFGYTSRQDFLSNFVPAAHFVNPAEREDNIKKVTQNENALKGKIQEMKRRDGTLFWVKLYIKLYSDNNLAMTVLTDITTEIQKQEEISIKVRELETANQELESFNFISSHDLQEPLRKIKTFSSLLQKEEKNISDSGLHYLKRMNAASERMQNLINDLLAYAQIAHSARNFKRIDLNKIFDEVTAGFQELIEEKNAIIKNEGLCEVSVIRFQLHQLFTNLISNSLKFIVTGRQPKIIIKSEVALGKKLHTKLLSEINYCHIIYTDNGIGFSSEYNEKVFELFERLHHEKYTGTGIGLAICKKIVDNHYGIITASGETNKGVRFDIYLPCEVQTG